MSLKGSEVRFRAAKKGQKCRLWVPTGDVWQRKRPKALLKSSEVGAGRQKRLKVVPWSDGEVAW